MAEANWSGRSKSHGSSLPANEDLAKKMNSEANSELLVLANTHGKNKLGWDG